MSPTPDPALFDRLTVDLQDAYNELRTRGTTENPNGLAAHLVDQMAVIQAARLFHHGTAGEVIAWHLPDAHPAGPWPRPGNAPADHPSVWVSADAGPFLVGVDPDDTWGHTVRIEHDPTWVAHVALTDAVLATYHVLEYSPGDLADQIASALAATADQVGGSDLLIKHRSGSWEAVHVHALGQLGDFELQDATPTRAVADRVVAELYGTYQHLVDTIGARLRAEYPDDDVASDTHYDALDYLGQPGGAAVAVIAHHAGITPTELNTWEAEYAWRVGNTRILIDTTGHGDPTPGIAIATWEIGQ